MEFLGAVIFRRSEKASNPIEFEDRNIALSVIRHKTPLRSEIKSSLEPPPPAADEMPFEIRPTMKFFKGGLELVRLP